MTARTVGDVWDHASDIEAGGTTAGVVAMVREAADLLEQCVPSSVLVPS